MRIDEMPAGRECDALVTEYAKIALYGRDMKLIAWVSIIKI